MADPAIERVVGRFREWAASEAIALGADSVRVEELRAPHKPRLLPVGYQGVYNFKLGESWLKSGMAGPKSGARWLSHHYSPGRAMSTLAGSLLRYAQESEDDPRLPGDLRSRLEGVTAAGIGDWIRANVDRHNILLNATLGREILVRLEQAAHATLDPVFEGRRMAG